MAEGPAASDSRGFGRAVRDAFFLLESGAAIVNHGSFGATPRPVLAAAEEWRRRMEAQPDRFMRTELPPAIRAAAEMLGRFIGARGEDLVFVDNATTGVNAVIGSFPLAAGDEVLTTTHVYGAVRNALNRHYRPAGVRIVEAEVPFPVSGEEEILAAVAAGFSPRTRLLIIDHVTSPTALIFPVARLAALARERGVAVLVDGAHAPGMIDLDVPALGVDWYVGNCHKWLMAPKSAGFLWAAPERQAALHPPVISHGYGHGFHAEFDWTGTHDYSPWLAVPAAIEFGAAFGWDIIRRRNHALLLEAVTLINAAWWTAIGGPPALLGTMATIRLPPALAGDGPADFAHARAIRDRLWAEARIEAPVTPFAGALWVRISAHIYNELDDYRRLAAYSPA
ncbi:MAG: aminotransferase class V-fold PLP-dependent enzyme [Rhodospirillales bacterium]|nr:aminotransferase class V-fold PLP-dependent enzyme [Rhodospirillales bacterium]